MTHLHGAGRLGALALLSATAFTHFVTPTVIHQVRDAPLLVGCFSSSQPLSRMGTYKYQSSGYCSGICTSRNQGVVGLSNGNVCWCGDELPPVTAQVLDSKCSTPCQGYGIEDCAPSLAAFTIDLEHANFCVPGGGGTYYLTIWLTGLEDNVPNYDPNSKDNSTKPSSTKGLQSPASRTPTTSTDSSSPTSKPTSSTSSSKSRAVGDRRLAIILALVFGIGAFAILALLFCYLWKRKKNTGTFFRGKSAALLAGGSRPSSAASSVPEATIYVSAGSRKWEGRISRVPIVAVNPGDHGREPRSTSEDCPFYTPQERSTTHVNHADSDGSAPHNAAELEHENSRGRCTSTSTSAHDFTCQQNPPTIMQSQNPNDDALQQRNNSQSHDPFRSSEDDEVTDAVSPMAPTKAVERIRSFPMVHYPSWSEVSDFDFSGDNGGRPKHKIADGWHPWRERRDGRYELA